MLATLDLTNAIFDCIVIIDCTVSIRSDVYLTVARYQLRHQHRILKCPVPSSSYSAFCVAVARSKTKPHISDDLAWSELVHPIYPCRSSTVPPTPHHSRQTQYSSEVCPIALWSAGRVRRELRSCVSMSSESGTPACFVISVESNVDSHLTSALSYNRTTTWSYYKYVLVVRTIQCDFPGKEPSNPNQSCAASLIAADSVEVLDRTRHSPALLVRINRSRPSVDGVLYALAAIQSFRVRAIL